MIAKRIGMNFFVSAFARALGFLISYFITLRLITDYLKEEGFGHYSTAFAFTYFFSFLADLGLYSLMTREISRIDNDEREVATDIFSLRLFSITISLLLATLTAIFIPYPSEVKISIVLSTLFYFFSSLSQVIMGIFQKYLQIWKAAIAEIVSRLIGVLAVFIVITFNLGVMGVAFATSFAAFFNFALLFPMARKLIPFSLSFNYQNFKNIFKKTWPIGLSIVFTVIYFKMDTILLSFYQPYEDVGIYNLSYKLFEGLIFFPAMFVGLIMPMLAKYAIHHQERFLEYFKKSFHLILITVLPLIIVLFNKSFHIVKFFGPAFSLISLQDAAFVFQILLGAFFFVAIGSLLSNALIVLEKQKFLLIAYFVGMVINIILNLIFVPQYSYFATGWTTLLTEGLVSLLLFIFLLKDVSWKIYLQDRLRAIVPSIILILTIIFLPKDISIISFLLLAALVYLIALYVARSITYKDLDFGSEINSYYIDDIDVKRRYIDKS